jgi:UDP-perosamine 4-acetyltransferase
MVEMSSAEPVAVIGCGDHARVVVDILRVSGVPVLGWVGTRPGSEPPQSVVAYLGDLESPQAWMRQGLRFVVGIGSNSARAAAFDLCTSLGLEPVSAIHPSAVILGGGEVGPGAQVCAGAIVGVAARVGANAIVNTGASLDHDNEIGAHAFVAPGARLAGRVVVGTGAHIGIGAAIKQGITIGEWSLVAAGAVVIRDVPAREHVAGVPAVPMRIPDGTDR